MKARLKATENEARQVELQLKSGTVQSIRVLNKTDLGAMHSVNGHGKTVDFGEFSIAECGKMLNLEKLSRMAQDQAYYHSIVNDLNKAATKAAGYFTKGCFQLPMEARITTGESQLLFNAQLDAGLNAADSCDPTKGNFQSFESALKANMAAAENGGISLIPQVDIHNNYPSNIVKKLEIVYDLGFPWVTLRTRLNEPKRHIALEFFRDKDVFVQAEALDNTVDLTYKGYRVKVLAELLALKEGYNCFSPALKTPPRGKIEKKNILNFDEKGYGRITLAQRLKRYGKEWEPVVSFKPIEDLDTVTDVYSGYSPEALYAVTRAYEVKATNTLAGKGYSLIKNGGFAGYVHGFDYPKLVEGTSSLKQYF